MVIFRLLALLLGLAFLLSMAVFTLTGEPVWQYRAKLALKWAVVLGFCFFGLLILRRAAVFI